MKKIMPGPSTIRGWRKRWPMRKWLASAQTYGYRCVSNMFFSRSDQLPYSTMPILMAECNKDQDWHGDDATFASFVEANWENWEKCQTPLGHDIGWEI